LSEEPAAEPTPDDQPAIVPRIIHGSMLVAVLVVVAVLKSIHEGTHPIEQGASLLLRFVGLVVLAGAGLTIRTLRQRVPMIGPKTDVLAWWRAHLPSVLTLWAIAEGVGILGSALWFVGGDVVLLVVLIGSSIALLLRLGPARWVDDQSPTWQG